MAYDTQEQVDASIAQPIIVSDCIYLPVGAENALVRIQWRSAEFATFQTICRGEKLSEGYAINVFFPDGNSEREIRTTYLPTSPSLQKLATQVHTLLSERKAFIMPQKAPESAN